VQSKLPTLIRCHKVVALHAAKVCWSQRLRDPRVPQWVIFCCDGLPQLTAAYAPIASVPAKWGWRQSRAKTSC